MPLLAILVLRAGLARHDLVIPDATLRAMALATLSVAVCIWRSARRAAPIILLFIVCADFQGANRDLVRAHPGASPTIDLGGYFEPSAAAAYLQRHDAEPFRYIGFAPSIWSGRGYRTPTGGAILR